MPLKVPDEPKVYTTTYDRFKGVDYTNDASNVFKRRSPSGRNMLPDLDGRPYKRRGWEIAIPDSQLRGFASASAIVPVIPDKTHYFELGGNDYLMIFNNLGVFSYKSTDNGDVLKFYDTYVAADGTTKSFPPQIDGVNVPVDSKRAFFFEGEGVAGFYFFVGLKLFRFDGTNLIEQSPKIPTVLISCSPDGFGETYEDINLLTRFRTASYQCDGVETTFTVLEGIKSGSTVTAEILNSSGKWTATSAFSVSGDDVVFTSAPAETFEGEDCLRITYEPDGSDLTAGTRTVQLHEETLHVVETTVQRRYKTGPEGTPEDWRSTGIDTQYKSVTFDTPNIMIDSLTKEKSIAYKAYYNGSWHNVSNAAFTENWCAYVDSVSIKATGGYEDNGLSPYATNTVTETGVWTKQPGGDNLYYQDQTITVTMTFRVKASFTQYYFVGSDARTAFSQCSKSMIYGNGIVSQAFLSASTAKDYVTRLWYSAAADPTYFPDLNYVEVGATDKPIMGMIKVGEYLGIVKKSDGIETSIYLIYPTSFSETTTFAVKQNIGGIGAISKGAFNILNNEPLFLSSNGVMGIEFSDEGITRNRSYYVNKRIAAEDNIETAVSFVDDDKYYLAVNGHCYVLDGSQKNSWENTKTNLQYECYYIENIPAQCFARLNGDLWFTDFSGNLCRFKTEFDDYPYHDEYSIESPMWVSNSMPEDNRLELVSALSSFDLSDADLTDTKGIYLTDESDNKLVITYADPKVGDTVLYRDYFSNSGGDLQNADDDYLTDGSGNRLVVFEGTSIYVEKWYTVIAVDEQYATVSEGVPIEAEWSTIADDDGMIHFFKNLRKKGCVISLLPSSDSGVEVYIKADNKDPVFVGNTDAKNFTLPFDVFSKKKIKKYKRLQFILKNSALNDSFGVDQIIKSYTVGNYSKNRK